ncbi:phosphotransferase family protein, partial [Klebsiella pneumoniae]
MTGTIDPALVDLAAVARWMDGRGLGTGSIVDASPRAGGTQNVLLRFTRAGRDYILRRPPPVLRPSSN